MTGQCPECAGPRLYGFTHQHATACALLAAEDATQAADIERHRSGYLKFTRPATVAELALAGAHGTPQADHGGLVTTTVRYRTPSVRHRVIGGIDPDQITEGDPQ